MLVNYVGACSCGAIVVPKGSTKILIHHVIIHFEILQCNVIQCELCYQPRFDKSDTPKHPADNVWIGNYSKFGLELGIWKNIL